MIRTTLACSFLLVVSGCQTAPWEEEPPEVDTALLGYASAEQKQQVAEARSFRETVREDLAIAERDLDHVKSRIGLARKDKDVVDRRLEEVEERIDHAREYGRTEDLRQVRQQEEDAEAALRLAGAKLDYYDQVRQLAGTRITLQKKRLELANALIELQKARVVSELDRPRTEEVDVERFSRRARALRNEVERAAIDVEAARRALELREEFVADLRGDVPEDFRMNAIEPLAELLTVLHSESEAGVAQESELLPRLEGLTGEVARPGR